MNQETRGPLGEFIDKREAAKTVYGGVDVPEPSAEAVENMRLQTLARAEGVVQDEDEETEEKVA